MSLNSMQGEWLVARYREGDGLVEPAGETALLQVEGDRVSGTMGVNRLMGEIDDNGPSGPLATTMMAGPPHLMDQEQQLLALLADSDSIVVGNDGMTWLRRGLTIVEFKRSGTTGEDRSS